MLTIDDSLMVNFAISYVSAGRSQESEVRSPNRYIEKRYGKRATILGNFERFSEIFWPTVALTLRVRTQSCYGTTVTFPNWQKCSSSVAAVHSEVVDHDLAGAIGEAPAGRSALLKENPGTVNLSRCDEMNLRDTLMEEVSTGIQS